MSRYHGEQYWTEMRHHTLHGWRDLSDDDFERLRAIRHGNEMKIRNQRERARRDSQSGQRDPDS